MWFKQYRDYKIDEPLIKERVSPGHGIIGCEMDELNGWGNRLHIPSKKRKKGFLYRIKMWMPKFNGGSKNA
jgi:hypothetical protein